MTTPLAVRAADLTSRFPRYTGLLRGAAALEELGRRHPDVAASRNVAWARLQYEIVIGALENHQVLAASEVGEQWTAAIDGFAQNIRALGSRVSLPVLRDADLLRLKAVQIAARDQTRDRVDLHEVATYLGLDVAARHLTAWGSTLAPDDSARVREAMLGRLTVTGHVDPDGLRHLRDAGRSDAISATVRSLVARMLVERDTSELGLILPAADRAEARRVGTWVRALNDLRDHPWGREADRLIASVEAEAGGQWLAVVRDAVEILRERRSAQERLDVSRMVAEAVRASGMSQAELARAVGTSPSRLSTYVSGSVTPSASMLLRIMRVAARPLSG